MSRRHNPGAGHRWCPVVMTRSEAWCPSPLLLRTARGREAAAVVAPVADAVPVDVLTAVRSSAVTLLWLGDVAIRDAVPVALATLVVCGDLVRTTSVVLAGADRSRLAARLAAEVRTLVDRDFGGRPLSAAARHDRIGATHLDGLSRRLR